VTRQMSLPAGSSGMSLRRSGVQAAPIALGFTFRDILRIFRRRLWWIILITILCTGIAAVSCYLMRRYRPIYTSTGMVICKTPVQEDILRGFTPPPNKDLIALETANQVAYLTSESFLNGVLGRMGIQRTNWFKKRKDNKMRLEDLKDSFSARAQRGTEYVIAQMSASNRNEAKTLLDEILNEYQNEKYNQATSNLRDDRSSLDKERSKIETIIVQKRDMLNKMREQANIPGWDRDNTVILPLIMGYRNQILNYQTNLDGLRDRLGVEHQSVQQVQTLIESLRRQSSAREQMLQQQYAVLEEQAIENRIRSLQQQYTVVLSKFQEISNRQKDLDQKRALFENVLREIEDHKRVLLRFEDRIYSTDVASDNVRREQEQIIPGTEPYAISFPRYSVFIPGGIFVGLLLSLGLIFLLEFIDDTIKSPSDVMRHLQAPLLGMIPEYDEEDAEEIELAKVVSIHPQAVISESFRQIRTNLYFSAPLEELKVMLITSSGGGDGKTTVAVNLGITFASEGKRVLLVDANFRRSALNRLFPAEGAPRGLSNVLVGQASAADVIRNGGVEGLDVIDAGPAPPNPAVLLSSERMQTFLANQREYYDHIIVDGPPALLLTDARILAGLVDGTIMVIHAGNTSRGIVGRMLRELQTDQVRILGVLLNAVRPQKGGYFRETYRNYYDYISHEPVPEPEPAGILAEKPETTAEEFAPEENDE